VNSHVSGAYLAEDSAGSVFAKEGNLIVTISGEKTNLKNFWSGRMTSTWTVVVQTPTAAAFSGEIKVYTCRQHYTYKQT
jgi:F-actin capping protein alpha subunit